MMYVFGDLLHIIIKIQHTFNEYIGKVLYISNVTTYLLRTFEAFVFQNQFLLLLNWADFLNLT